MRSFVGFVTNVVVKNVSLNVFCLVGALDLVLQNICEFMYVYLDYYTIHA